MVLVVSIAERNDKACVGDAFHEREKPFREDKSRGPATFPAKRRKGRLSFRALAFSSCSRTMRPAGTPVRREVSSSQSANSRGSRIVSVLRICHNCKTIRAVRQPLRLQLRSTLMKKGSGAVIPSPSLVIPSEARNLLVAQGKLREESAFARGARK